MVITRMRQVAQRINAFIQRPCCHFVQQRFPQVAVVAIHQRHLRFFTAAQFFTQLCRQFKPASTTANNHNFLQWCSQRDPLKIINQLLIKSYKYNS